MLKLSNSDRKLVFYASLAVSLSQDQNLEDDNSIYNIVMFFQNNN